MAGDNWCRIALVLQVVILVCHIPLGHGKPRICLGESCSKVVKEKPKLDVLGAYCYDICYSKAKELYAECQCERIITTLPPPCTTSYLQTAVCDWASRKCEHGEFCDWRKNKSLSILSSQNIKTCDCPLKEKEMKDPCKWTEAEMTLCSILKVNKMLYADFQCLCDPNPPAPPPGSRSMCEYTKHRPAHLVPKRQKRLFAGNSAYPCNYPGVVGIFTHMGNSMKSICTATLLSQDTILFDKQCKMVLTNPVYALVDSYDVRMVNKASPTVRLDTVKEVDVDSASNALFTAKLSTKVVLDNKCVQPACLPNVRIPAHHVNLDDCRVLGYGDTTDTFITGPQAKKLQEIKVKVISTSVTSDNLEVIRHDGYRNTACLNEFASPLVCSHKYTKEWITVGIHKYIGVVCSGNSKPFMFQVANLLSEAMGNQYYDHLKSFQPAHDKQIPV